MIAFVLDDHNSKGSNDPELTLKGSFQKETNMNPTVLPLILSLEISLKIIENKCVHPKKELYENMQVFQDTKAS